ncbi:hypothetical protein HC031_07695 [Planosporangium thailandense]|uniref:Transcriptional regulator n=1 Tax=Planosporangium thailandense TaxID=765197 RepID=A0ABX0XUB5_9ACTN|nr:hypothetical protein [Planosporangium thailandense]NJC69602.1 hypothetical protein [Planosporangium thailandense]
MGDVSETADGLYAVSIWPASAAMLAQAPDPAAGPVVVEGYLAAGSGWTKLRLPFFGIPGDELQQLTVRRMSLDLLLSPSEFAQLAPRLEGTRVAGLEFWQTYRDQVPQHASLSDKQGKARRAAFIGLDVAIAVQLPHDGEVAVLAAPTAVRVQAALKRIMDASDSV